MSASQPAARNLERHRRWLWLPLLAASSLASICDAQVCQSAADMSAPVRTALETAAKRYFEMSSRGDTDALKQNSIASVAASFSGIEAVVK